MVKSRKLKVSKIFKGLTHKKSIGRNILNKRIKKIVGGTSREKIALLIIDLNKVAHVELRKDLLDILKKYSVDLLKTLGTRSHFNPQTDAIINLEDPEWTVRRKTRYYNLIYKSREADNMEFIIEYVYGLEGNPDIQYKFILINTVLQYVFPLEETSFISLTKRLESINTGLEAYYK